MKNLFRPISLKRFYICVDNQPLTKERLLHHTAEAHESQGQDTHTDDGDGDAFEGLGDVVQGKVLADAGKDDHGEAVAQ